MTRNEELRWIEDRMLTHHEVAICGELGNPLGLGRRNAPDESVWAYLNCAWMFQLPDNRYAFLQLSYNRTLENPDTPVLRLTEMCHHQLPGILELKRSGVHVAPFFFSEKTKSSLAVSVRRFGGDQPVLDGDPWMLWHLGVLSALVRELEFEELSFYQDLLRQLMANSLERLATARIKRVIGTVGRG